MEFSTLVGEETGAPSGEAREAWQDLRRWERLAAPVLSSFRIPASDADDLLQDAYLALFRNRRPVGDLDHWFVAVLSNRCRKHYREQKHSGVGTDAERALEIRPARRRSISSEIDLGALLDQLTERERRIVEGRHLLGKSFADLARELGPKPASLRRMLLRAMARLRRLAQLRR